MAELRRPNGPHRLGFSALRASLESSILRARPLPKAKFAETCCWPGKPARPLPKAKFAEICCWPGKPANLSYTTDFSPPWGDPNLWCNSSWPASLTKRSAQPRFFQRCAQVWRDFPRGLAASQSKIHQKLLPAGEAGQFRKPSDPYSLDFSALRANLESFPPGLANPYGKIRRNLQLASEAGQLELHHGGIKSLV